MTCKEKLMAAYWLDEASNLYGNHGCNDIPKRVWDGWSIKERKQFVKDFGGFNGDPEDYDPDEIDLPDFCVMSLLADKLRKEVTDETQD